MAARELALSGRAIRQLRALRTYDQRRIITAIRKLLIETDPREESRNRFRLHRASEHADYELRVGDLRVFYRVDDDGTVYIALIGVKDGNRLLVEGEEFQL